MGKFTGFLDNLASGALSPKGNLGDFRHASRTFVDDAFRLAPKSKFLYHVFFQFNPIAFDNIKELGEKHKTEIGLLVKRADLPKFSATVDTKKKYNRVKHVQTSVTYDPINITFHDDNFGVTTAILEAYYRYYFADGNYGKYPAAYNKTYTGQAGGVPTGYGMGKVDPGLARAAKSSPQPGDNTYLGTLYNKYAYGLDNDVTVPFINNIQISQLSRKTYTTYTLVNPIITNWSHDSVDASDGSGMMENNISVSYEAVWYDRGSIEAGANGNPTGFGDPSHYDTTPSPASLLGGGQLGLGGIFGAGVDLYDYITKGGGKFSNPFEAGLAAAQLIGNVRGLSSEGLREEGFSLLKGAIGAAAGTDVSGVSNTVFPKNGGNGGGKDLVLGAAAIAGLSALSQVSSNSSSAQIESAAKAVHRKQFQNGGGAGGINESNAAYDALPETAKQQIRNQVTGT
jgi:hypothetical protein|tara:strand:+ start:13341 stop:14705 length:1365 start_codon:yes stop_codon:yes gene_type:complete